MSRRRSLVRALFVVFALAVVSTAVYANHSWNNYHWATSGNGLSLDVGDNVSSNWDAYLDEALDDWNQSQSLNLVEVAGGTRPKNCRPTAGQIEVCNARYGNNGWLGIAQIWLSGGHISQAITKLNDTYFNTATYNTPAWRRLVACQEIAHDFGLDHQDETFDNPNLGSCMDYTNDPDGGAGGAVNNDPSNEHPNSHDYQQITSIYSHSDGGGRAASEMPPAMDQIELTGPGQWGRAVHWNASGKADLFLLDFGHGHKVLTHVFWVPR